MAKAKARIFPFIHLALGDNGDKFNITIMCNSYGGCELSYNKDYNSVTIPLPPLELELDIPDDLRPQVLDLLDKHRDKIVGEHRNALTRLEFTRNQLLGLAAPEILDAGDGPSNTRSINPADGGDIPF